MKRAVTLFTVILCSFLYLTVDAGARDSLPPDAAALLDMEGETYYLAHNLHTDKLLKRVYSINYQLTGGLIPWGTEVEIVKVQRNYLLFREVESGVQWNYWFSGRTRQAVRLEDHVRRVFVENIDEIKGKVASLSELDRDGIYEGRVIEGMSRSGVLVAMGYPPEHANGKKIMKARDWHYWLSRFNKITVSFNRQGNVARVVD